MKKIVQKEDEILRETAQDVPVASIMSPRIAKILAEMKQAARLAGGWRGNCRSANRIQPAHFCGVVEIFVTQL